MSRPLPSPLPGEGEPAPDRPHRRYPWLTRNLTVASAVSLAQDTASELLYPVMPIFLTVTLGAPAAAVGIVEGIAEACAAASKLIAGVLADRFRRKPLIGLGYGLAALGKAIVAIAGAWPVVLLGRGIDRLGKGVRGAPRDALIAAGVPRESRGKAFGFHRTMDTAGAVLGPLAGLGLYHLLGGNLRPLLLIAVIPGVLSALLVLALREPRRSTQTDPDQIAPDQIDSDQIDSDQADAAQPRPAASRWPRPGQLPARYWQIVVPLAGFALLNFPDALLLLRMSDLGFSLPGVIGAYVLFNLTYTVLSMPAGALADRLHPATVFGMGVGCFAAVYTGLALVSDRVLALVLMAGYGGFAAATDGVGKAWVSRLLPQCWQGSGQGVFQSLTGIALLVAGLWAGLAWGEHGRVPLLVSGLGAVPIAIGLIVLGLRQRRTAQARR